VDAGSGLRVPHLHPGWIAYMGEALKKLVQFVDP